MAENKKVVISVEIKEVGGGKLSTSSKKATKDLTKLTDAERAARIEAEKLKITNNAVTASLKQEAAAALQASAATNKLKTNSGLNNAIIAESARLASDASFGFTAIANNLGQLVSLFSASANAAGGLRSAFVALFSIQSLFLIGIQLLITYGNDLYNFFIGASDAANKYKKSLEDLTAETEGNRRELLGYIEVLRDVNSSEDARLNALQELDSAIGNVIDSNGKNKLSLDELTLSVEEYIRQQRLRMELDAVISSNGELFAEREKIRMVQQKLDNAETLEQQKEIYMENASFFNKFLDISEEAYKASGEKGLLYRLFGLDSEINFVELFRGQSQETIEEYDAAVKKIIEIQSKLPPEDKKEDGGSKRRDFIARQLNFDKEIIQSQKRVTDSLIKNNELRIKEEFDASIELAKIRQENFAEAQQRRVDAISNEKDKAKAQAAINIEIANSEASLNNYIVQLTEERNRKVNQLNLDQLDKATELLEKEMGLRAEALLSFEMAMATNDFDRFEVQRDLEDAKTENILKNLDRVRTAALLAGEQTIGIDEKIAKTKEHLSYKQMQIDEAEAQAKLAVANQVAEAIIAIAGEQSAVGKAVAVAMATINTYEAVTAALGAKPYGAWNIAQAAATAAMGFVQVRKILQTDIPGGKGGGAGGGTVVEAPDFNVVGASPESQLAQSVSVQQGKPLRSFVVLKDIQDATDTHDMIFQNNGLS